MLQPGVRPDDFTLPDQDGAPVRWADLRGQPVVVFCYPKASTPGCTTEACDFRDRSAEFAARGVKVLGLSADPVKRQSGFARKYELTMPLLCDEEHTVLEAWGVWQEKQLYGRKFMGIVRSTFLFDASGELREAWTNVKVNGHADAVLAAVDALPTE